MQQAKDTQVILDILPDNLEQSLKEQQLAESPSQ